MKNKINYFVLQLVILLTPILVIRQVIESVGTTEYANYINSIIWLQFTFTVTDFGLSNAGVKFVADNPGANRIRILLFHAVFAVAIYIFLVNPFFINNTNSLRMIGEVLYLISLSFFSPWFYNSINSPIILSMGLVLSRSAFLIMLFFLHVEDLSMLWFVQGSSYILAGILCVYLTPKTTLIGSFVSYKKYIYFALHFAPIRLSTYGYVNLPLLIISRLSPDMLVQIDFALKLKALCMSGVIALNNSYFYEIFSKKETKSWISGVAFNMFFCMLSLISVYVFFDLILKFVRLDNVDFSTSFYIVLLSVIPISISGPAIIFLMKKDLKLKMLISSISTLIIISIFCVIMIATSSLSYLYTGFLLSELVFLIITISLNYHDLLAPKDTNK